MDDSLHNVEDLMPDAAKPAYSGTSGPASDGRQGRNGARRKRLPVRSGSGSREIVWSDKGKEASGTGASTTATAAIATSFSSSEAVLNDNDDSEDAAMDNGSDSTDEQTTLVEGEVSPADSSESPTGPDANHTEQERPETTNKTLDTNHLANGGNKNGARGSSAEQSPLEKMEGSNWVPERSKGWPPKHVAHQEVRDSEASLNSRAMSASPRILRAAAPREGLEDPSPSRNHAPTSARSTMYASLQSLNRLNFRTEVDEEEPAVLSISQVLWKKVESKAAVFFSSIARRKE